MFSATIFHFLLYSAFLCYLILHFQTHGAKEQVLELTLWQKSNNETKKFVMRCHISGPRGTEGGPKDPSPRCSIMFYATGSHHLTPSLDTLWHTFFFLDSRGAPIPRWKNTSSRCYKSCMKNCMAWGAGLWYGGEAILSLWCAISIEAPFGNFSLFLFLVVLRCSTFVLGSADFGSSAAGFCGCLSWLQILQVTFYSWTASPRYVIPRWLNAVGNNTLAEWRWWCYVKQSGRC